MKLLFINNFFSNYGGTEITIYEQANLLRADGHEVYFFATDKSPFLENIEYAEFFPKYTDYSSLSKIQALKNINKPFYNFEAKNKLELLLDKIQPDLVHYHNIYYHLTPAVLKPCFKRNIPTIMSLNDPRLMCPGGTLMLKNESYCKNELCLSGNPIHCLTNTCKNNSLKESSLVVAEYLFNKFHNLYDRVSAYICPSNAIKNLATKHGLNSVKLKVINSFIKSSFFQDEPHFDNQGYFLYVGRLSKEKGIHYLLEAMSRLPDAKLRIVGKGPEEDNLKKLAQELNLSNVDFLGFLTDEQVKKEYKNCIATILPCNWFETFGLTIAESFAYGKPVIASKIGAIPELIENYKTGITFEPGNIDELTCAIKNLHSNNALVKDLGATARAKAERSYTSTAHYSDLIRLYESLI